MQPEIWNELQVIFDGPAQGKPGNIRVRVTLRGVELGAGDVPLSWWERVGAIGWRVAVNCRPEGHPDNPIRAHVPRHSPAQLCDCPNPRPGRPFHCAVGVPSDRG